MTQILIKLFRNSLAALILIGVLHGSPTPAAEPLAPASLDEVPMAAVTGVLPAPATWPAVRYEHPLRMLVLTTKGAFISPYQAIARRIHGVLETRYINGGDARYHVNDKWIEPDDAPVPADLTAYAKQVIVDTLKGLDHAPRTDVVFVEPNTGLLSDAAVQSSLLSYLKGGGVVVVDGSFAPSPDSGLSQYWPTSQTKDDSWMTNGSVRSNGPELAGVPTDFLTGSSYIAVENTANGGRALATGQSGSLWSGAVGKGTLLYCPTGPMTRRSEALTTIVAAYDHDEIWLRYWDQVLYESCAGSRAFPAYVDAFAAADTPAAATGGAAITISGIVVNRTADRPLAGSVYVIDPLGHIQYRADVPVSAALGSQQPVSLSIPVSAAWSQGIYRVIFTLADKSSHTQLHSALAFVNVPGVLKLSVVTSKPGYRIGESALVTVSASSPTPWHGVLLLGIYDFRGRLLWRDERTVSLSSAASTTPFTWQVADEGVRVDTYRIVVAAEKDGAEWARAESSFDKSQLWSMRSEYQWSPWSSFAVGHASTALPAMRLIAHAGFNALGYPGWSGLSYLAERWGWRYYNEGIGINTWSPLIDCENESEIDAEVRKQAAGGADRDLASPAFVLASVGEEAGYSSGWGRTYYWDTPVAPPKACRAFQWYLKTIYPSLDRLNATWRTSFNSWDDIELTQDFSSNPAGYLQNDGWAHPKVMPPLSNGALGVSLAPFINTENFYTWYYDRFIEVSKRVYHEQLNPVSLTMASAPSSLTFASSECDVANDGPGGWNESQVHSVSSNEAPDFGLIWGHFDWLAKDDDLFWGFLLKRTGHNDFWWDALMFNGDMTHTRATMALRRWTAALAGHEQAILDSVPGPADIGILAPNGLFPGQAYGDMHTSLAVALMQGGFSARDITPAEMSAYKVVFAVGRLAVSAADAQNMEAYVDKGGTLVFMPGFASQDEYGGAQPVSPGQGLADKWAIRLDPKHIESNGVLSDDEFPLDGVAPELKGQIAADVPYTLPGAREDVKAPGWALLSSFPDGTPAIVTSNQGKGKLVYFNAGYVSHHYIQFVTATDAPRQGYFRLMQLLCRQSGAKQALRLDGDLSQMLHLAVKQFTDSSGHIRYLIVKSSIGAPWVSGRIQLLDPHAAVYDVLTGDRYGSTLPLHFAPSQGRWFAVLDQPVKRVTATVAPTEAVAGQTLRVSAHIVGDDGAAISGRFPITVTVALDGKEIPGLRRSCSLAASESIVLPTALNDPAGVWTVRVTDGITGLWGQAHIHVAPASRSAAPQLRPMGWPSDFAEPQRLSREEFLGRLHSLCTLYTTSQAAPGGASWMAKQELGAYYDFFPGTRHAFLRPLYDVQWADYVPAWREALTGGAIFVLTGEDLGVDPGTGLSMYPHFDAGQIDAVADLLRGAAWSRGTSDGDTVVAKLGQGQIVLCRESIDAAGNTSPEAAAWQQRWLQERSKWVSGPPIAAMDAAQLRSWWTGVAAAGSEPRVVTWFADNLREETLKVDPATPLESVVVIALPPGGRIASIDMDISADSGPIHLDVGADNAADFTVTTTGANSWTPVARSSALTGAVTAYLATLAHEGGPKRDLNGWIQIPIRITSPMKTEVHIRNIRIVVD